MTLLEVVQCLLFWIFGDGEAFKKVAEIRRREDEKKKKETIIRHSGGSR